MTDLATIPGPAERALVLGMAEHEYTHLARTAAVLAGTRLVAPPLQGRPEAIIGVGLQALAFGVPLTAATLRMWHVWEQSGQVVVEPSAQLYLGLIHRAGHRAYVVEETAERAVIEVLRGDDGGVRQRVEFTLDRARRAGLLDEWVEDWSQDGGKWRMRGRLVLARVDGGWAPAEPGREMPAWASKAVADGKVRRKDSWHLWREDMLVARCSVRAYRRCAPDASLALMERLAVGGWGDDSSSAHTVVDRMAEQPSLPRVLPAPVGDSDDEDGSWPAGHES